LSLWKLSARQIFGRIDVGNGPAGKLAEAAQVYQSLFADGTFSSVPCRKASWKRMATLFLWQTGGKW
jgi:hypothetical protein